MLDTIRKRLDSITLDSIYSAMTCEARAHRLHSGEPTDDTVRCERLRHHWGKHRGEAVVWEDQPWYSTSRMGRR